MDIEHFTGSGTGPRSLPSKLFGRLSKSRGQRRSQSKDTEINHNDDTDVSISNERTRFGTSPSGHGFNRVTAQATLNAPKGKDLVKASWRLAKLRTQCANCALLVGAEYSAICSGSVGKSECHVADTIFENIFAQKPDLRPIFEGRANGSRLSSLEENMGATRAHRLTLTRHARVFDNMFELIAVTTEWSRLVDYMFCKLVHGFELERAERRHRSGLLAAVTRGATEAIVRDNLRKYSAPASVAGRVASRVIAGESSKSWHNKYRDSAWVFIGGLDYDLTEGDVICVFSQWGEVVNINLVRDKKTGKSKGFAFLCYEDQRSTILAVDNFNGTKICNRIIRVDHVEEYKVPKVKGDEMDETMQLWSEGVAPKPVPIDTNPGVTVGERVSPTPDPQLREGRDWKKGKKGKNREDVDLLPLDAAEAAAMKKHKKALKKAKKEAKKAKKDRQRMRSRSGSPVAGSSHPIKAEPHANFGNKKDGGKRHYDDLKDDDYDRPIEHKIVMTKYDEILIQNRYKGPKGQMELPTDWRAKEVEKMERDRQKAIDGDFGVRKNDYYMPKRFSKA